MEPPRDKPCGNAGDGSAVPSAGDDQVSARFPWRGAIFTALTVILIALALIFYNTGQQIPGLAALGLGFSTPMAWVILAAREASSSDSAVRRFLPRMMLWLVTGAAFLGMFWWNVNRIVSVMEAGFGAFYVCAGVAAMRIFDAKQKRPGLHAIGGRDISRRKPPRSR